MRVISAGLVRVSPVRAGDEPAADFWMSILAGLRRKNFIIWLGS